LREELVPAPAVEKVSKVDETFVVLLERRSGVDVIGE